MAECYAIKDWEERFCVSQGKRVVKWSWVALPINPNGEHYRVLMETPEGREAYCVFMGLLGVAANGSPKGFLADKSGPLSVRAIHYRIGIPVKAVERGIEILSSPEIGWLVLREHSESTPSTLGDETALAGLKTARSTLGARSETHYPTPPNPTGQNTTKPNITNGSVDSFRLRVDGDGGGGERLFNRTPAEFDKTMADCGISTKTRQRLVHHSGKFQTFDLRGELARLQNDRSVTSATGALIGKMAKHAGINLDTKGMAGALTETINGVIARRAQNGDRP